MVVLHLGPEKQQKWYKYIFVLDDRVKILNINDFRLIFFLLHRHISFNLLLFCGGETNKKQTSEEKPVQIKMYQLCTIHLLTNYLEFKHV